MREEIRSTKNYNRFEMMQFNRDVDKVEKLEQSMSRHGFIHAYPLHVVKNKREKLLIKAGHHRYVAAKKLGIPIKYTICNDEATIHELEEATKRWSLRDYLNSYVRCGMAAYLVVDKYINQTGISIGPAISMLGGQSAGSHNHQVPFKRGEYKLGDPTHAGIIADIVIHLKNKCNVPWGSNSLLVQALSKIAWVEMFKPTIFKHKAKTFSSLLEKQPNLISYIQMIENIYNRQAAKKIPLTFLAEEVAREREAGILKRKAKG